MESFDPLTLALVAIGVVILFVLIKSLSKPRLPLERQPIYEQ